VAGRNGQLGNILCLNRFNGFARFVITVAIELAGKEKSLNFLR